MDAPGTGGSGTQSIPLAMCDEREDYLTCKYVVGELFRILRFVNLFTQYADMLRNALSDPLAALGSVIGLLCRPECDSEGFHYPHKLCTLAKILAMVGAAVSDIMNYIDNDWQLEGDYCNVFEEMQDTFCYTDGSDTSTTSSANAGGSNSTGSTGSTGSTVGQTGSNVTNSSAT